MIPATSAEPTASPSRPRDGFLDAVKVIALWRVVVWHALAWPWLSWFAAMPAMFYVAGVLLQQSLDRHGYRSTLRARIQRLLIPFWVFGLVAGAVMAISGWRPRLTELIWWVVPLGDPIGADSTPGFWIPLWYLRAYLWVLIAGALLSWACRRFGTRALLGPVVATLAVWGWQSAGNEVPLAIADAALFPFFVMAGMLTAIGHLELLPRRTVPLGLAAGGLAVAWYHLDGAPMGIINGSLPVHLLAGVATIGLLVGIRRPLANPGPRAAAFVRWSSSRALTIYLWHGLGLVVADRLVHQQSWASPVTVAAGLGVVVAVTLGAAAMVGGLEDRSARRLPRPAPPAMRRSVAPAGLLVVAALVVGDVDPDRARVVPSGEVVMARAEQADVVDGSLDDLPGRGSRPSTLDQSSLDERFEQWLVENQDLLVDLDTDLIEVALVDGTDETMLLQWTRDGGDAAIEPFPWWSMSKTMTAAWMMQLADEGVIELDASLDEYLATVPNADRMTLEQLASHQAGIPSDLDGDLLEATPIDEIGAYVASPDLAYEPGEGYDYSRVGYHLLTWGLEEASGSSWRGAMEAIADEAGVTLMIDEDLMLTDGVTHPGGGDYRGNLWGAGGLHGTTVDGARLFRWTLMEALGEDAVRQMSTTEAGGDPSHYGLGLTPNCPCVTEGGQLSSDRVGLSTITGIYVVDLSADVGLMLRTDNWWSEAGPALEFDELIRELLDTTGA